MSADQKEHSSIKYIPFSGKREDFKEWESKIVSIGEAQGWLHHLDRKLKTVTYEQFGIGFKDLDPNDSYDVSNCSNPVSDWDRK